MTRDTVRGTLQAHLSRCDAVLAMWEGGSTAFGRNDEYSDLDIAFLYKFGAHDEVWRVVDEAFAELGGVDFRWRDSHRLPPGWEKRMFRPRHAESWMQVDVNIIPDIAKELYNQPERDGRIVVLFDRSGRLARPPRWDEEKNRQRVGVALHQSLMRWEHQYGSFRKQLARGRTVDAFMAHFEVNVMSLVTVLNIRYRPSRWQFGLRYLKEELPPEVVKIVEQICYVPSPAGLEERFAQADLLLQDTVKELEEQGTRRIDPFGFDIWRGALNTDKR